MRTNCAHEKHEQNESETRTNETTTATPAPPQCQPQTRDISYIWSIYKLPRHGLLAMPGAIRSDLSPRTIRQTGEELTQPKKK